MNTQALGLLEVTGIAAALEAADIMAKSATIRILSSESCGRCVTLAVQGEAVHVRAALEAAECAPGLAPNILHCALIPAPHPALEQLLPAAD